MLRNSTNPIPPRRYIILCIDASYGKRHYKGILNLRYYLINFRVHSTINIASMEIQNNFKEKVSQLNFLKSNLETYMQWQEPEINQMREH